MECKLSSLSPSYALPHIPTRNGCPDKGELALGVCQDADMWGPSGPAARLCAPLSAGKAGCVWSCARPRGPFAGVSDESWQFLQISFSRGSRDLCGCGSHVGRQGPRDGRRAVLCGQRLTLWSRATADVQQEPCRYGDVSDRQKGTGCREARTGLLWEPALPVGLA